jgi:autotransporter passenger strand-loop-strand repeat protein
MVVESGGTAISTTVNSGGRIFGGVAISTTVNSGGEASLGSAISTTVNGGGEAFLTSAISTAVSSGGFAVLYSTAISTAVSGGGIAFVERTAISTTVENGGEVEISSSGSAVGTTVSSGGGEVVFAGGTTSGTDVESGGCLVVLPGGIASGTSVQSGGAVISTGVVVYQTSTGFSFFPTVANAIVLNSGESEYILPGGSATSTTVSSGGCEAVYSGGTAISTTAGSGGDENVYAHGIAIGTAVGSGGDENVYAHGIAIGTAVGSGGDEFVSAGGTAVGTTVSSGGAAFIYGSAVSTSIGSGGEALIFAFAASTMVSSGGYEIVYAGAIVTGTDLMSAGTIDVTYLPYATGGSAGLEPGTDILSASVGGHTYTQHLSGDYGGEYFRLAPDWWDGTDIIATGAAPCFAAGTRIATARGAVAVEALAVGDKVRLAGGGSAPVVWLGHRSVACARHPRPWDVMPVRVAAHAFGAGQPGNDLVLSPDHAVFIDGVLIPIRYLLNGATIVQEQVERMSYWHVELEHHDLLLADGLACESYLDTGNRGAFANGGDATMMHADFARRVWERACCAPLITDGAELEAARSFLLDRARVLGFTLTDEPDLHLVLDGLRLGPDAVLGSVHRFVLPGDAAEVVIASRAAVPQQTHDVHPDGRRLGVMLGSIAFIQDGATCELPLERLPEGAGFHALEQNGAQCWRWTDGRARLAVPAGFAPDRELVLELHVAASALAWLAGLGGCLGRRRPTATVGRRRCQGRHSKP